MESDISNEVTITIPVVNAYSTVPGMRKDRSNCNNKDIPYNQTHVKINVLIRHEDCKDDTEGMLILPNERIANQVIFSIF